MSWRGTAVAKCHRFIDRLRDAAIEDLTNPLSGGKRMPPELQQLLRKWEADLAMFREAERDLVEMGRGKTEVIIDQE